MKQKTLFIGILPLALAVQGMKVGCGECSSTTPVADFPTFTTGLNTDTKRVRGGITGIVFLKCSDPLADNLQVTWQAAIDAGNMVIRKDCGFKASKTSEAETEEIGACATTVVTRRLHTVTFEDTFDNDDYDVAKLWIHFQENPSDYLVYLITCDGVVYPAEKMDILADRNIEDTNAAKTFWSGTMTYERLVDQLPLDLAFDIDDLTF